MQSFSRKADLRSTAGCSRPGSSAPARRTSRHLHNTSRAHPDCRVHAPDSMGGFGWLARASLASAAYVAAAELIQNHRGGAHQEAELHLARGFLFSLTCCPYVHYVRQPGKVSKSFFLFFLSFSLARARIRSRCSSIPGKYLYLQDFSRSLDRVWFRFGPDTGQCTTDRCFSSRSLACLPLIQQIMYVWPTSSTYTTYG
jgi:hypothetical protein